MQPEIALTLFFGCIGVGRGRLPDLAAVKMLLEGTRDTLRCRNRWFQASDGLLGPAIACIGICCSLRRQPRCGQLRASRRTLHRTQVGVACSSYAWKKAKIESRSLGHAPGQRVSFYVGNGRHF